MTLPLPPTEMRAVLVGDQWWPYAEGSCEHDRTVRYSREVGYQRHLDGTECEEIIRPLGAS